MHVLRAQRPRIRAARAHAPVQPRFFIPTANQVFDLGPFAVAGTEDAASVDSDLTTWAATNIGTVTGSGTSADPYVIPESTDGAPAEHFLRKAVSGGVGVRIRFQCKVRKPSGGRDGVLLYASAGADGKYFNVSTGATGDDLGTVSGSGSSASGTYYDVYGDFPVGGSGNFDLYLSSGATSGDHTYQGDGRNALEVYDVSVTQLRHSAYADQFGLHSASQATAASQPLWGPNALGASREGVFDGTDDYMTLAAGSGWPGATYTSHSLIALFNRKRTDTTEYLVDFQTGRLIFAPTGDPVSNISWYDGTWRNIADATTGWQIVEWHLDAGAATGEIIRTTSAGSTSLGTVTYSPQALGGTVSLGARNPFGRSQMDFGRIVMASFTSGTAPEWMRQAIRHRLLYDARTHRIAL